MGICIQGPLGTPMRKKKRNPNRVALSCGASHFFLILNDREAPRLGDLIPGERYRGDGDLYIRTFGDPFEDDIVKSQQSRCEPWSESLFF